MKNAPINFKDLEERQKNGSNTALSYLVVSKYLQHIIFCSLQIYFSRSIRALSDYYVLSNLVS